MQPNSGAASLPPIIEPIKIRPSLRLRNLPADRGVEVPPLLGPLGRPDAVVDGEIGEG